MFIELTESLRCPRNHDEAYCVLDVDELAERRVRRGTLGCPRCRAEYLIVDGVVEFDRGLPAHLEEPINVDAVGALLGSSFTAGYIVVVGSAAANAEALADRLEHAHVVSLNAPEAVHDSPSASYLRCATGIPLRQGTASGVLLGRELDAVWMQEAARVLPSGRRVVVVGEEERAAAEVRRCAVGSGFWLGERV